MNNIRGKYRIVALKALETSEKARNDDWLYFFNFLYYGMGIVIPKWQRDKIRNSNFKLSTILRERQKIQNGEGLFQPSPETKNKRMKNMKIHRELFGNSSTEKYF